MVAQDMLPTCVKRRPPPPKKIEYFKKVKYPFYSFSLFYIPLTYFLHQIFFIGGGRDPPPPPNKIVFHK